MMTGMGNITNCKTCIYRSYLFSNLQPGDLSRVSLSKKEKEYDPGDIIVRQGDKITSFMYLKSGLLKISRAISDGKNQIISIARPLDFIGLLNVFSNNSYQFGITAIEHSTLCFIDLKLMKDIIGKDGHFALKLLEKMSGMNDMIMHNRLLIDQKNLRGRIAYILLFFSQDVYKKDKFSLPVSRKEIAELINMRTENVIRILSEFRRDRIIGIEGKIIRILDRDKLIRIAEFG